MRERGERRGGDGGKEGRERESKSGRERGGTQSTMYKTIIHDHTVGNDTEPQWQPFRKLMGPQTTPSSDAQPEQLFSEIFSLDVWDLLVRETNRYAHHKIYTTLPSHHAILSKWRTTCRDDMMGFIGLVLTMGILQLSDIKDYWDTQEILNLSLYRDATLYNEKKLRANESTFHTCNIPKRICHSSDHYLAKVCSSLMCITPQKLHPPILPPPPPHAHLQVCHAMRQIPTNLPEPALMRSCSYSMQSTLC